MSAIKASSDNLAEKYNLSVLKEGQIATQNKRGVQMATISPLFNDWFAAYDGKHALADIGCAYGINSLAAAKKGADVLGIDMGEEHFPYVRDAFALAKAEEKTMGTVTLLTGSLPSSLPVAEQSLSGILLGEVMHFIPGKDALTTLKHLFSKLAPGGMLCLHCMHVDSLLGMPQGEEFLKLIKQRLADGVKWPGEFSESMTQVQDDFNPLKIPDNAKPDFLHVFTEQQIFELATEAGFEIVSLKKGRHPGYPQIMQTDTSNLQLVAKRPVFS